MWTMKQFADSFMHFKIGNTGKNRLDDYDIHFTDESFFVYGPPPPDEMVPQNRKALEEMGWEYKEDPGGEMGWGIWRSD